MKILRIRFENIHSLKGEHEINFDDGILAEAGIFAITGPTGSGKSTLLDVITLALYDNVARMGKISGAIVEDDGGIMTRNMKSCYAEVEYRANGKTYRSHWSLARNRNNNLNPRKLELVEAETGNILSSSISETPKMNEKVIGLSYDQFIKAIVLSQGEFSRLLKAPRDERNKLLEDITGARSYREIGIAVYFRFKKIENKIDLKEATLEGIQLLTEEAIAELKNELNALTQAKPKTEKEFQKAAEKIKVREELQGREKEWKALENEKEILAKDLKVFEEWKTKLDTHDRLSKHSQALREFDLAKKELEKLRTQADRLKISKKEAEKKQKSLLASTSQLLQEEVTRVDATTKLEAFREKVVSLQAEESKKQEEISLYKTQLNKDVRKINQLDYNLPVATDPNQFKPEYQALGQFLQKTIDRSKIKSIAQLNESLETLRSKYEIARDLIVQKELEAKNWKRLYEKKQELQKTEDNLSGDQNKTEELEKEIPVLKAEVETLEKSLDEQRRHQSLDSHRQRLQADEPCPLCGSLDHPYALEAPYFNLQEETLKEKKATYKEKNDHLITLKAKNGFQLKEIKTIKGEIKTISDESLNYEKTIENLATQLHWEPRESLESFTKSREQLHSDIKALEGAKRAFEARSVLKDISESLDHWENTYSTYSSIKNQRSKLYEGNDINQKTSALATQITQSIAKDETIEQQISENDREIESMEKNQLEKERVLSHIVSSEHLKDIDSLRKGILPEEKATRIRKQGNKLNEQKTRISEKEKALKSGMDKLRAQDDPKATLDALRLKYEEAKEQWDSLSENIGKLTQSLIADKQNKDRQQKVLNELTLLKKDHALWKTMRDLIGDRQGNKFSNFVQDLTLEQLIGFANKRLSEFTDRYLVDIPTAEEAEKSDTLKVLDRYMGNARRSVRTLSGGETFLVSLAMALALSDIAARNVKIESLFIDEGFGTLDPETLDQAITILEKMQYEGDKSVGVISHVSALKERITTQIKLEKGSLGYSTLAIVQ